MYPEARALVAAHLRKGHTVVLASSALSFQVEAVAADLDIEHVLCTRFEVVDGRLTGALAGPHLWGVGKRRAVEQLAADQGIDLARSFAYADGSEDVELLEVVGNPRPTNPTRGLERKARERGWPVHRFVGRGAPTPELAVRHVSAVGGFLVATATGIGLGLLNRRKADAVNTMVSVGSRPRPDRGYPPPRGRRGARGRTDRRCSCSTTRARSTRPPDGPARRECDRGRQEGAASNPIVRRGALRRRGVHRPHDRRSHRGLAPARRRRS